MFDLKHEVSKLARNACGNWLARRAYQAEIEDYLYCVIEEHLNSGATEEVAFCKAREQLGGIGSLRAELQESSRIRISSASLRRIAVCTFTALVIGGLLLREGLIAGWTWSHLVAVLTASLK
jgi:hypothetical protein